MRAQADDKAAGILVDTVYLKMRNEVQARYVIQKHKCTVGLEGVALDCGVYFQSEKLAKHLEGCEECLLFAATLGMRVDAVIRRLSLLSVAEGAAAQAVGAALIESYCDEVQAKLDVGDLHQRPRFSPGYGDWQLEDQKTLFAVLDCAKTIGLTLTDGCMMAPSKSVTAIIGLSKEGHCLVHKCANCPNVNCEYRQA